MKEVKIRRSDDGGASWGAASLIGRGIHGGGLTVDEITGHVLVFVEDDHPPAPLHVYKSTDDGRTFAEWKEVRVLPDAVGRTPAMHFNEKGVTMMGGAHHGRLVRAARWYAGGDYVTEMSQHFTTAVYSDDRGLTWRPSQPFPGGNFNGTGEAAVVTLRDGSLLYNSRRHWAPCARRECDRASGESGETRRRWGARSEDGAVWSEARPVPDLPDGPQGDNFGMFGGLARLEVPHADVLLYSNCDNPDGSERRDGAVWLSVDGGASWPHKRAVAAREFGYSALAVGRAGTASEGWIYCVYEGADLAGSAGGLARFNVAWLAASNQAEKTVRETLASWVCEIREHVGRWGRR